MRATRWLYECALVLTASCGLLALSAGSAVAAGELTPVTIGFSVKNDMSNAPFRLAKDKGIYERYGLNASLVYFRGGGAMIQALLGNKIQYGWGANASAIQGFAKGAPVRIVGLVSRTPIGWGIMVRPASPLKDIKDIKKGMKISYTSEGSLSNWLALYAAQKAGLNRGDIVGVPIGSSLPGIKTALDKDQIDAATVLLPWGEELEAAKAARWLVKMPELVPGLAYTGIDASVAAANDKKMSGCLLGAYKATIAWMKGNRESTIAWLKTTYGVDDSVTTRLYDALMPDYSADGIYPPALLQTTIDILGSVPGTLAEPVKAEDILAQAADLTPEECTAGVGK